MEAQEKSTLNKILKIAENEFLNKGFQTSSLREIVKKAGVTTGAFYGYFKSKEELFDALVKEHVDFINTIYDTILSDFEKMPLEVQQKSMDDYSFVGLNKMFDYVWEHKRPFRLIILSSAGTKYENFIQNLAKKDIDSTDSFYDFLESNGKDVERINPMIENIVITSTFTNFFTIILKDIPKEEAALCLSQLFRFYRGGWNSLMKFDDC